jgi:hypothetical protein
VAGLSVTGDVREPKGLELRYQMSESVEEVRLVGFYLVVNLVGGQLQCFEILLCDL